MTSRPAPSGLAARSTEQAAAPASVDDAVRAADADPEGALAERRRAPVGVRLLVLVGLVVLLVAACWASLTIGERSIPLHVVLDALTARIPGDVDHEVVWGTRVPRTIGGIVVGAGIAVAGALIQAVSRNPLADPGILGVNAGAAFAVALSVVLLGASTMTGQLVAALLGAFAATAAVLAIGALGRGGLDPIRLTLAGVAFAAVMSGLTTALTLMDVDAFATLRSWGAGSLSVRGLSGTLQAVPFIVVGLLATAITARSLDAVALGEDLAASLGVRVGRTRVIAVLGVTFACAAATAVAGPIGFVGLMVPHVIRFLVGPNQAWVLGLSVLGGPVLLLAADVLARIAVPGGMPVGVVTAFVGAPVLIAMVRSKAVSTL